MSPSSYEFRGKGLSVAEPWASAIAYAGKDIENRSWRTHYRGPLAIHASAKVFHDDLERSLRAERGGPKRSLSDWIVRGQQRYWSNVGEDILSPSNIVAIAMIVDCVEQSSSPWFGGEWGWVLQGVIPILPIPWTGGLGIWDCRFKYQPL